MELSLLNLSILFIFITILLLLSIIHSKLWWGLKAFLIIISVFFYYSSYTSLESMLGRPTSNSVADNSVVIMHVEDPPKGSNKGRIIILVKDKKDYKLHQIPYNLETVKKLRNAKQQVQQTGSGMITVKKLKSGDANFKQNDDNITFEVKEITLPSKD